MHKLQMRNQIIGGLALLTIGAILLAPVFTQIMEKRDEKKVDLPQLLSPRVVIRKKRRVLEVYDGDKLIKTYAVVLGFAPEGDKQREGDGKTPEGEFYIFTKNAESKFHLSLGLSYPSIDDAKRGLATGAIAKADHDEIVESIGKKIMPPQKTALGGEIYIHGGGVDNDWTWGCTAMKNEDIEELFAVLPIGTAVTINP